MNRQTKRKNVAKHIVVGKVGALDLDPKKKYLFIFDPRYIPQEQIVVFGQEMIEIGITNVVVLIIDGRGLRVLEHNGEFTLEKLNEAKV